MGTHTSARTLSEHIWEHTHQPERLVNMYENTHTSARTLSEHIWEHTHQLEH